MLINLLARKLSLIAPKQELKIVTINGSKSYPMIFMENYNSDQFFERDYGITDYTVLKSNDDWDHGYKGHFSRSDFTIENKEISGNSINHPDALFMLSKFFDCRENNDFICLSNLVDKEYAGKFIAMLVLTSNQHTIYGDQMRYIYDHNLGLFKFLFKNENYILERRNFNTNKKKYDYFEYNVADPFWGVNSDNETIKTFKLLLEDNIIRSYYNKTLSKIINESDTIRKEFHNHEESSKQIINRTNYPSRVWDYEYKVFIEKFDRILENINKYLGNTKIYLTFDQDNHLYSIKNDGPFDIKLSYLKDKKKHSLVINGLPPSQLKNNNAIYQNYNLKEYKISKENFEINFLNLDKKINENDIYFNSINISENNPLSSKNLIKKTFRNEYNSNSYVIKQGNYNVYENIIFDLNTNVIIEEGVNINIDSDKSILIKGNLEINGSKSQPVKIRNLKNANFGVIAVNGSNGENQNYVSIKYLELSGGNTAYLDGVRYIGQMSLYNLKEVKISKSKIMNSLSDDGLNIKNTKKIEIINNFFTNNNYDQVDIDYSDGIIKNNYFSIDDKITTLGGDGLDLSGSNIMISENDIIGFNDKGISVGENTISIIQKNNIENNLVGVAVKDGSKVLIRNNNFKNNSDDISSYIKKKYYDEPEVYLSKKNEVEHNSSFIYLKDIKIPELFKELSETNRN